MKISEVIAKMKAYHKGTVNGVPIDESKTRDKVLYGNVDQECTGIVTTIYASVDVIREAIACMVMDGKSIDDVAKYFNLNIHEL